MGSTSILGGSNPQGLHSVFVYGSLLADDVVRVLLKRVPESSPAVLNGFHRFSIKGRVYPAILPLENKKVIGKVLSGITAPEIAILDTFEDVEYERRIVEVSLMEWKQAHMNDFIKMTMGFMEELELPESKPRVATYESFYQQTGDSSPMS
ncbi:AIG2-like protein [Actinidia chinensis var. chinensis]|uniref:Putative gamma-glutamylcyclotransferase n=1 Tax=Actinidia chinensis var. chinensis TaxID=1590841 RepID=A0A2R6QPD3_ACTCC|nr:AIG2-like protein [Actinidia chinensis var. chinensis]